MGLTYTVLYTIGFLIMLKWNRLHQLGGTIMKYLSAQDIQACFSMKDAIAADKAALASYSAGQADIPLRTNLDVPDHHGQALFMPGYVRGHRPALGMKIVSVYPDNARQGLRSVPATMVVMDAHTGIVSAILDGTYLTQLRTGAVQGAATDLLARADSRTALLIGTGGQAMSQLIAMLTVRPLTKVYIADRDYAKAQRFVSRATAQLADRFTATFEAIPDPNAVVVDVDIITCVTTAHDPVFDGHLIRPGTHINGIGAYTPAMHEVPTNAIAQADRIFVDTEDGTLAEAGDLLAALHGDQIDRSAITGELGQLVNGNVTGRTADQEITFFKTVGTAVLDVVVASQIVDRAKEQGIGTDLN